MIPVSAKFAAAIQKSHTVQRRAELWSGIGGSFLTTFDIVKGSAKFDIDNSYRGQLTCTIEDPTGTLSPSQAGDLFTPLGQEIIPKRGLLYDDGTSELVQVGIFGIVTALVRNIGQNVAIDITATDRSYAVSRAKLIDVLTVGGGMGYGAAIQMLVSTARPNVTFNINPAANTYTTLGTLTYDAKTDLWRAAQDLASSIGYILYFDSQGICVLRPEPTPANTPVSWTFDCTQGNTNNMALEVERVFDGSSTINFWVVTGESSGSAPPIRAVAYDSNPASLTYVGNPVGTSAYGVVPDFFSSPLITSTPQGQDVANALLQRSKGLGEKADAQAVCNPALETLDCVTIISPQMRMAGQYILSSVSVPFGVEQTQAFATRRLQA